MSMKVQFQLAHYRNYVAFLLKEKVVFLGTALQDFEKRHLFYRFPIHAFLYKNQ